MMENIYIWGPGVGYSYDGSEDQTVSLKERPQVSTPIPKSLRFILFF